jgi:membrane-associated phospholipid phosphatase
MWRSLHTLTELGDSAVLMPIAAAMLVWLLLMRAPRIAMWWAIAVAFCIGLTAVLKVSFYGCPPAADLHSPSGHTSLSTLVYGAMALVTATESAGWPRLAIVGGGAGLILAIAVSRLLLQAHTAAEVGLGLTIGIGALAVFTRTYVRYRAQEMCLRYHAKVSLLPMFLAGGALVIVLHGWQFHAEHFLHAFSAYLGIQCR